MGQIQMAVTTIWTQSGRRCPPRETWQSTQRHSKSPHHCRWCSDWCKSWSSPCKNHHNPARNCKSKQHHLKLWHVCLQVKRSHVLQWRPECWGIQCWPHKSASHYRNEASAESLRSLELPGTSQLHQLLLSKGSRNNSATESTQQEGHNLHLGKLTASIIWGNPGGNHKCTYFSMLWQDQAKHHTVSYIQNGARSSSSPKWQAINLCIQKPYKNWTTLLQHWERTSKCCSCTLVISSVCLRVPCDSPNWPPASSQYMEEDNIIQLTMSPWIQRLCLQLPQNDVNIEN